MSVYKRPGASTYSYDFWRRGHRFCGQTGRTAKRDAQAFEAEVKRAVLAAEYDLRGPMSFLDAVVRFWSEVGQFRVGAKDMETNLAWLCEAIGRRTPLSAVNNSLVASLVVQRRADNVAPATINRSVVEPLRAIIRRATLVWDARVAPIEWRAHRLREPQERVREASRDEEDKLVGLVPPDYRPLIRFAVLTGCRRAEALGLRWEAVNFEAREFRVTGKGSRSRTIPMVSGVYDLLRQLEGHHPTAVFTFKAERARDGRRRLQRYPITANGLQTMWDRCVRGNVGDLRFHDLRHTAATRLVRATGNLKLAQRLLGHTNVSTTSRYAHVTHEELRAGLEAVSGLAAAPVGAGEVGGGKRSTDDVARGLGDRADGVVWSRHERSRTDPIPDPPTNTRH